MRAPLVGGSGGASFGTELMVNNPKLIMHYTLHSGAKIPARTSGKKFARKFCSQCKIIIKKISCSDDLVGYR